eukprot:TRINITY_DN12005_c0_g2_i1.p7 TRINITY_DN12005_c0_g2~~TRINITY_DN12005_c0_g2_i1.p7  ORF type:complete len:115 (-),score=0.40 TRINITY_DN12005_c0_g2_i1:554-898(-)
MYLKKQIVRELIFYICDYLQSQQINQIHEFFFQYNFGQLCNPGEQYSVPPQKNSSLISLVAPNANLIGGWKHLKLHKVLIHLHVLYMRCISLKLCCAPEGARARNIIISTCFDF